jgi:hypothetical protein
VQRRTPPASLQTSTGRSPPGASTSGPAGPRHTTTDLLAPAADYQLDFFESQFGVLSIHIGDQFDDTGDYEGTFMDAATTLIDAAETASEHNRQPSPPLLPRRPAPHLNRHHLQYMPQLVRWMDSPTRPAPGTR